jgi:hypothetical protein
MSVLTMLSTIGGEDRLPRKRNYFKRAEQAETANVN